MGPPPGKAAASRQVKVLFIHKTNHMLRIIGVTLLILLASGRFTTQAQARKVIIDTDAGIDDAVALVFALQHPGIEIVGITTVSGNAYVDQCTKNALRVVELSGKNIPVFRGAEKSLVVPLRPPADFVHGKDGLGNTNQPEPKTRAQAKSAAQFIVDATKANPGQITILAVGKLTNLAQAIRLDSAVTRSVKEVVVVGGALRVPGLATPVAEPDMWLDPHAADMVFTAPWKVTMIGLDVNPKVTLSDDLLLRISNKNAKYGPFVYAITRFLLDFHRSFLKVDGINVHDASAIMYLIDPSIYKFRQGPVRVVTEGIAIGQTIMPVYDFQIEMDPSTWKAKPLVSAAHEVDVERYLKTFEAVMVQKPQ
jgi:inosine-uridine nucleoside N-ribohydrolase